MGMYTGFVCKIKVKEKYYDLVEFLQNETDFSGGLWNAAYEKFGLEFLKEYGELYRSDFIPRGGYTPYSEDWLEKYVKNGGDSFLNGVWFFGCDMKNHDDIIESFVRIVLPKITEEVFFIKSHYEEYDDDEGEIDYSVVMEEEDEI